MAEQTHSGRTGARLALLFFAIGVGIAAGMLYPMSDDNPRFVRLLVAASFAGALIAWKLGAWTERRRVRGQWFVPAALATAWLSLVGSIFFGGVVSLFPRGADPLGEWLFGSVVSPVAAFAWVGTVPALVLGALFALVLASRRPASHDG